MKIPGLLILTITLLSSGCEKNKYDVPGCIEDKIKVFKRTVVCDHDAYIALYTLRGENVYVFSDGYCATDLSIAVYSDNCYLLGFLGGISANTLISGLKFYEEATFIRRLWEN